MKGSHRLFSFMLIALFLTSAAFAVDAEREWMAREMIKANEALKATQTQYPNVRAFDEFGVPTRLYGQIMGTGNSAVSAAEQFRANFAEALGTLPNELVANSAFNKDILSQEIMYDEALGKNKFTLVYYHQERNGIPVFRGEIRVLVRNESNYPVVLAASAVRPLGDFDAIDRGFNINLAQSAALANHPDLEKFTQPQTVIYAGINDVYERPRMAVTFVGADDFPEKYLFVADAETGAILYEEDLILHETVTGQVQGLATQGTAAEQCEEELAVPLKNAYVTFSNGTSFYTDHKGGFSQFVFGTDPIDVTSYLSGIYFDVFNYVGSEAEITQQVTPPGHVLFTHNSLNTDELVRAQVNGYYQANRVRDMVLAYCPTYPSVSTEEDFPVYVNRTDGYCPGNAWYDSWDQSVNFCKTGSGYPNTAWQSVIFHEYGHRLVNAAGSGQDQYGEGMGDCIAILDSDESGLGFGFYGNCTEPLRDADNTMQYPCSGEAHSCAGLLSGCIWDLRNELLASNPANYRDILKALVINSILLHTGSTITPQITIDFLTLDDDDADIDNGTPHYSQICAGFSAHNMDCPELTPLWFSYPNGMPEFAAPDTPTTFEFIANQGSSAPITATGKVYYQLDGGAWLQGTVDELSANDYEATIPGIPCGTAVRWYIGAEADGWGEITDPKYAPSESYPLVVATQVYTAYEDGFESDQGWTFSGGEWAIGSPTGGGGAYGGPDPSSAYAGSGVLGYDLNGDYGNNIPEYHATSPAIDCSGLTGLTLSFQRWLGVEQPVYDHAYVRISNNGSTWTTLWENDATIADLNWSEMSFDISQYADNQPTVYIRFTMGVTDVAWTYCGWNIDELSIIGYSCESGPAPLDIATENLPDWTEGAAYDQQLLATGGTGAYSWQDKNGDLVGTGLSLSSTGLLSGTPNTSGMISFIAQVTDETPESAEQPLTILINPGIEMTATSLPDWTINVPISHQLTATGGTGALAWSDMYGDLPGTGLTLSSGGLLEGSPLQEGAIEFTCLITDDAGATFNGPMSITINPAVAITTDPALPDGSQGNAYSMQLESTGGTGAHTWVNIDSALAGTGLSLSGDGLVSGTPLNVGDINFTGRATDAVGGYADQGFTLTVLLPYVCGDANGDSDVGIADAVFLINFVFKDGPAPEPSEAGDANCDGTVNIGDGVYIINFVFNGGGAPCCP